ncbi:MAG: zinc-binding dehydrogenase [Nocardioidaceae bacterium]
MDAVADVAGGPLLGQLMPLIRDDGRWVIAGAVAGPVVEFDLRRLYLHNIRLIGSSMHTRDHFSRLVDSARRGTVRPVIAGRYPLDGIAAAQEHCDAEAPDSVTAHAGEERESARMAVLDRDQGCGRVSIVTDFLWGSTPTITPLIFMASSPSSDTCRRGRPELH